jgi:hypothetical protein
LGRVGSSGAYRGPTVAEAGSAVAMPNIYLQPDKPQLKKKKNKWDYWKTNEKYNISSTVS